MVNFTTFDWVIVFFYFIAIGGIAWVVMKQKAKTTQDYFLASRHVAWYVIGASIFASNIGSEHVVGLASTGVKTGVAYAHYELHSWCVLLLGWIFVPFYLRSKVFTMPEFLELRFNSKSRLFLSAMSLVAYVLTKVDGHRFLGRSVDYCHNYGYLYRSRRIKSSSLYGHYAFYCFADWFYNRHLGGIDQSRRLGRRGHNCRPR